MMTDSRPKRRYNAPRRRAQAAETRARILASAERLFVVHGYAATTLASIASAAGVSLPTVTATFGTKCDLLAALIAMTVRGDEAPAPLRERDWWIAALVEPDPVQLLERYAANIRRIHERTTDIFEIVRGAATADPAIADLRRDLAMGRLDDCREVAAALATTGWLKPDMTINQVTDIIWALVSAEFYRLLVVERGWTPETFERWLSTTFLAALLDLTAT